MQLSKPFCAVGEFIFSPYRFLYKLGWIIIAYQLAKRMLPPIPFLLHVQHKNQGSSETAAVLKCSGTKPHRIPLCCLFKSSSSACTGMGRKSSGASPAWHRWDGAVMGWGCDGIGPWWDVAVMGWGCGLC